MAHNKYVNYPEIGNVLFEKSGKAKRVIITVKSPSNIRVSVPRFISIKRAGSFVFKKIDWIKKQQNKYSKKINVTEVVKSVSLEEKLKVKKQVEYLANKYNFKIKEAPIVMNHEFKSSVNPFSVFWMLWDTSAIFYRDKILRYYNEK